jgi:hypothetical protein
MSLDLEQQLKIVLASAPPARRVIQTLEISHSDMSQVYYLWAEPYSGSITTDAGVKTVQPVNLQLELAGAEGHLDQNFAINIDTTRISDDFREELDAIALDTTEEIDCVYREYLSDDLTTVMAQAALQVEQVAFTRGVASISAVSPRYNVTRTGEIYAPRDVPMLRGFL